MSRNHRDLTPEEMALWARVASTVTPLGSKVRKAPLPPVKGPVRQADAPAKAAGSVPVSAPQQPHVAHGLDASWDRKLSRGTVPPDYTLDLHGCTLDAAHGRLIHGLTQARAMGARVVLLVTGRPRPTDAADRASRRGAIRAKAIDWLAASEHAHDIAAIRGAHPRHGGQGALYVVLRKRRN